MKSLIVFLVLLVIAATFVACSGGNTTNPTAQSATVSVGISDPATCSATAPSFGIYQAVYVTITDVQINASANAGDNDPSWIDLTPNLKNAPQQVNLLGLTQDQKLCFLATLGDNLQLQPGSYQQIRLFLADNSTKVANDQATCKGVAANCVVLAASPNNPQPLLLSSQAKTGIKIPSGQIAGGQFTIAAGQTKDLDINFDTCASVVVQGNGQFRLKPVLRAGEVSLTSSSINGKLVDNNGNPITTGKAIVVLEENESGIDRKVMQTTPDATGAWVFCPVTGAGPFDIVVVAVDGNNVAYAATIVANVSPGSAVGNVKLYPNAIQGGMTTPVSLQGTVTTANASSAGTVADIQLSALQTVTINGASRTFTIPGGMQSAVVVVPTAAPTTCTTNPCPDTASYTLTVPPANPTTGVFSANGTTFAPADPTAALSYTVEALAFVQGTSTADCTPSRLTNTVAPTSTPTTVPAFNFSGCQ